eukprot:2331796-Amphidinium_carterae.1
MPTRGKALLTGIGSDGTDGEGMLNAANGCNGSTTGRGDRGPEQTRRSHGLTSDGRGIARCSSGLIQLVTTSTA